MEVLTGKKCKECGFKMIEPSFACLSCGSENLEAIDYSGKGTIYTYTVVHVGFGHLAAKAPYVLAVVELAEGLKVLTRVEDADMQNVKIGDSVKFKYTDERKEPIFQAG